MFSARLNSLPISAFQPYHDICVRHFIAVQSFEWETLEAHNLFQLLHAEALRAPADVADAISTAVVAASPEGMPVLRLSPGSG